MAHKRLELAGIPPLGIAGAMVAAGKKERAATRSTGRRRSEAKLAARSDVSGEEADEDGEDDDDDDDRMSVDGEVVVEDLQQLVVPTAGPDEIVITTYSGAPMHSKLVALVFKLPPDVLAEFRPPSWTSLPPLPDPKTIRRYVVQPFLGMPHAM